jgi:hypothetical protein
VALKGVEIDPEESIALNENIDQAFECQCRVTSPSKEV